jgi:hypothetical protein
VLLLSLTSNFPFLRYGVMIALEKAVALSPLDLGRCGVTNCCCPGCLLVCFSPCIPCIAGGKIGANTPDLQSCHEYGRRLQAALGEKGLYFGGDEPCILDVSIFGVIAPFVWAGTAAARTLLGDPSTPLSSWFGRMEQQIPKDALF